MIPTNKYLYEIVKKEADERFLAPTSVYKSAWIVKTYKKRGGSFDDPKNPDKGLLRWFREKWVDLNHNNRPCGRSKASLDGVYPLCRPTIKVTKNTPKLASELDQKIIKKAIEEKQKNKHTKKIKF
jgi:hypothetical protein